jgi:hypothetical protein
MARTRWLEFLSGPEFGLLSTLLFAGLYTWPFLTFDRPSATFRFIFTAWCAHIALIAATNFVGKRLEASADGGSHETEAR